MLTFRDNIQLHIGKDMLTTGSESFGQRISSNYGLLRSKYTAKNLLFLLTAPQELPEQEGNMTTLVSQQNETNIQSITMDVVNNVINRILLDGTTQFTYQDQVYITSVLNRLGVTNMEQFMQQIRQLRTENEMTYELTETYREQLQNILIRQARGEAVPQLPLQKITREDSAEVPVDPRVSMSLQIFERIGTSHIYKFFHQLQRNWRGGSNLFQHNEFRFSEQLRLSNQLSLAEIKQQIYDRPEIHLLHHLNKYETSLIQEAPQSEEEVLSQAAVASLVTAVDQTVVEVLNRPDIKNQTWLHLENALWQTSQETLSRYESYHSQDLLLPQTGDSPLRSAEYHYQQELKDYQTLLEVIHPLAPDEIVHHLEHLRSENTTVLREHQERTLEKNPVLQERHAPMEPVKPAPRPDTTGQETVITPPPMTLKEAEEQAPEVLVEELTRIDQHNRTVMAAVQQELEKREQPVVQRNPDIHRTMRDSLRALENPEVVLQELQSAPDPVPEVHLSYTPEEEAILAQADPATRKIYEKILMYDKDPEQAMQQGGLRPSNIGALSADLQQAVQTPEELALEYAKPSVQQELPPESQAAELFLERFLQKPVASRTVETVLQTPEAIRLIHKQTSTGVTEEMLDELRTERTQTNVQTETKEQVNRQQTRQVDFNQQEHHIVTQTTEDLTELVNRTLSKQMRTISDQVYHQMEKRLKTERTRRGRY